MGATTNINAILLQIVASRLGGTGNPAIAEMLVRMTSGNSASLPTPQELLGQIANNSDPTINLLAKQLGLQQAKQPESHLSVVREVEPEFVVESTKRTHDPLSDAAAMEVQPATIPPEMKELRSRCDDLAAALGACPLCWGNDAECRACRGRGHPGYSVPDKKSFVKFVLPAIQMLKARTMKNNGSSGNIELRPTEPGAEHD
jgi:hypothetical protein